MGYEYEGKTYAGRPTHPGGVQCTSCHDPSRSNHTFRVQDVWKARCEICHADAQGPAQVRPSSRAADYDGDGNTTESLAAELEGLAHRVLVAMRAKAVSPAAPICYSKSAFPYFFRDTNGSGPICDPSEAVSSNGYTPWTPQLMKAAHNYQISKMDPAAYAHNFTYLGQLLYDSLEDLTGAPPVGPIRP
jgi:predicted CXXCH cytochrome family protein